MSEIDSVIESIRAGVDALKKAGSLAEGAEVPAEDRATLEQALETLRAMSDRMNDLAMTRGTTRKISTMHLELEEKDQET